MFRRSFFLLAFGFAFTMAMGQSPFSISPSPTLSGAVQENGVLELQVDVINTSGGNLILEWELMSNTFDPNWNILICDWQNCYFSMAPYSLMDTLHSNENGFLKLTIQPGTHIGSGMAEFKLWANGDTSNSVLLTYNVDAIVNTAEPVDDRVQVYPNPVADQMIIDLKSAAAADVQLIDINGRIIREHSLTAGQNALNVEGLTPGTYFAKVLFAEEVLTKRVVIGR